ncbi:MAG: hypothetical protein OXT67_02535 [Zetaproteobacteria bacterium]|nr:hypothetical protein [Zetaproteobacteria bacterium]
MLKIRMVVVLWVGVFWVPSLVAGKISAGVQLGDFTGFSVSQQLSENKLAEVNVGWYRHAEDTEVVLSAHYNTLFKNKVQIDDERLSLYLGVGLKTAQNGAWWQVRAPAGILYEVKTLPMHFFMAFIPGMSFIPSTDVDFSLALGGRYTL